MKVKIYYVEVAPELESKEFDLASVIKAKGECIVGRSPECDLPLEGSDLSRQHGRFWLKDNYYYFADLGSSNGSLFNGELAEPNHEYLLNIGDTIRLGDFVLKMEPAEEIAATVMKVIDPALFKPRPPQIVDASQPEPQISPLLPVVGLAAAAMSMPMIVDSPIERLRQRSEAELPDLVQPLPSGSIDDRVEQETTSDVAISEPLPPVLIEDEWSNDNTSDYLQYNTFEQAVTDQPLVGLVIEDEEEIEPPNPVMPQYNTFEQVTVAQSPVGSVIEDEDEIELPDPVIPARSLSVLMLDDEDNEVAELTDPVVAAQLPSTLVLDDLSEPVIGSQPSFTSIIEDEEKELAEPVMAAQLSSPLVLEEEEEEELAEPFMAVQSPSAIVLDKLSDPVIATQPPSPLVLDEDEEEELAESVVALQPPSTLAIEDEVTGDLLETEPAVVVDDPEEPELIASIVAEQPAETLVDEDDETIVAIPNTALELHPATTLAIENTDPEQLPDLFATSQSLAVFFDAEAEEDEDLPDLLVTPLTDDAVVGEIEVAESLEQDKNLQVEPTSSVPIAAVVVAVAVADETSINHKKFGAKLLSQKQIVLIAHDEKVPDLTDLVNQNKDFLSTCLTISWASIAGTLREETGISVSKELPSGVSGGFQALAGLVNSGDVLAVIFLKDFLTPAQTGQANEEALLRLCNINEILLATNMATAESIVHYLQS